MIIRAFFSNSAESRSDPCLGALIRVLSLLMMSTMLTLGGCATSVYDVNDPWEPMNRGLFKFNKGIDTAIIKPAAQGYGKLPRSARNSLRNFVRNLREPIVFVNDVLQAKPITAGKTASRFLLNSTFGLAGLMDVATDMGLEYHSEDFGQTLAVWGVPAGPYFYVPVLGPLPPRDLVGYLVDILTNPLTWVGEPTAGYVQTGRMLIDGIDDRERALDTLDNLEETSLDFYATIRSLYRQNREFLIRDGEDEFENLPDFDQFQ